MLESLLSITSCRALRVASLCCFLRYVFVLSLLFCNAHTPLYGPINLRSALPLPWDRMVIEGRNRDDSLMRNLTKCRYTSFFFLGAGASDHIRRRKGAHPSANAARGHHRPPLRCSSISHVPHVVKTTAARQPRHPSTHIDSQDGARNSINVP